jgi:hypothetical protein
MGSLQGVSRALAFLAIGLCGSQVFGQSLGNGSVSSIFNSRLARSLAHPDTVPASAAKAISQIADGAGWKTTFILANSDTVPASFTLNFWKGDGSPLALSIGGQGMQQVTGQIPVDGIVTIATDGSSPNLSTGWGQLISSNSIGGTAIFRESVPGQQDTEAGVPLIPAASPTWLLPFDNTGPQTSAALVNPDPANSAAISVIIYDQNGNPLVNTVINLPPMGQVPFALSSQFPATQGKKGLAVLSNPSGGSIVGLGLRFSGAPFTSIPLLIPGQ